MMTSFYVILTELFDFYKIYASWNEEEISSKETLMVLILSMRSVSRQMPSDLQCEELVSSNIFAGGYDYKGLIPIMEKYLEGLRTNALK